MKRKWIKKIAGALSLTSALFIFQACYGTDQNFGPEILIKGIVTSKTTGLPIEGIKVTNIKNGQYELTYEDGSFNFYSEKTDSIPLMFEDIDSTINKSFLDKDTLLLSNYVDEITLNIELQDK